MYWKTLGTQNSFLTIDLLEEKDLGDHY